MVLHAGTKALDGAWHGVMVLHRVAEVLARVLGYGHA